MKRERGFTLLEVLIVLAIMAIALGIGYVSLARYIAKSQFISAQQQFVVVLDRARSGSRKLSQDQVVTWQAAGTSLQLKLNNVAVVTVPNTSVSAVSPSVTSLTYSAPHGRVNAPNLAFTLASGTLSGTVRVLGVTGKAIRDDQ